MGALGDHGVDRVAGAWVSRWSLGQVLMLTVLVFLVGYLFGLRAGILALLAFGLTLVEKAPDFAWLLVLGVEVATRVLRDTALRWARVARVVAWAALVATSLPFVVEQVRFAANPASMMASSTGGLASFLSRDRRATTAGLFGADRFIALSAKPAEEFTQGLGRQLGAESGYGVAGLASTMGREQLYALKGTLQGHAAPGRRVEAKGYARAAEPPPPPRADEYDPTVVVQTGPGLPRWNWKQATLGFDGPVQRDQRIGLYLAPPWFNRGLAVVKVVLLGVLAWLLLRRPLRFRRAWLPAKPLVAGIVSLILLVPAVASADDYPPKEILDALAARLVQKPECAPECAAVSNLFLDASPERLRMRLEASALVSTAIALPGDLGAWSPRDVIVDGRPAVALARDNGGRLWLALEPGLHDIVLSGPLPNRDSIQLTLPTHPRHASSKSRGFLVSGIHEDGAVDESILLSREAVTWARQDDDSVSASALPPFLSVRRTLVLGLKREAYTEVTRQSPEGTPIVAEIPLLPGESVTTAGIRTEKSRGTVSVDMGPRDSKVSWSSTLAERPEIRLRSDPATASRWVEIWRVEAGSLWHATFAGIPPVRPGASEATHIPEWAPRPGEEVRILVSKPTGVPGQTFTIDASSLTVAAGLRNIEASLSIELRSSRGTEHKIALPTDAEIFTVRRDGSVEPIRQEGRALILGVPPGRHTFHIAWRQPSRSLLRFAVPAVDLGAPSTNSTITLGIADQPRWILWFGGPGSGPSVGLWPLLCVLLLAAAVLSRKYPTPLRTQHWFVLALGLTQVEPLSALLVPACVLALGWRARGVGPTRPALYNVGQVAIVAVLAGAAAAWASVIDNGLSRLPNMLVAGAAEGQALWYQDRAARVLAQPWVLSLPMWLHRGLVLLWALWSVMLCLRCARWAWTALTKHGLWMPSGRTLVVPPPER